MSTWDAVIFNDDNNEAFLDELADLPEEDILAAVTDACQLALKEDASEEERANGLAAATIAAIWAGAPYSAGDVAEEHPYIRSMDGSGDDTLHELAEQLLGTVDDEQDVDQFVEALS